MNLKSILPKDFSFPGQMVFYKKIFKYFFQFISMIKNITPIVAPPYAREHPTNMNLHYLKGHSKNC